MRFRLLHRRLTISAPRMAVRSTLPWPLRWVAGAVVLGFCAAIGLWAFEFGKDIAGLDKGHHEELIQMRAELAALQQELVSVKDERDKARSIANTSSVLLTAEKTAQERLLAQNKQLETDNQSLRDDLGFFEKLIPTSAGGGNISIRGLQAEMQDEHQLKWQVLVIQPLKNAPEFNGRLELIVSGTKGGKPWTTGLPGGPEALKLRQYGRFEGVVVLPPDTVVKNVSAKILDGSVTKAAQSVKL